MGSVQQITLGVIILGAAFILGHYVNQLQSNQETTVQADDQKLDDAMVWQKRPTPIKTMTDDATAGSFVDLQKQAESDSPDPKINRLALKTPSPERNQEAFPNIIQPAIQEVEPDFSSLAKQPIKEKSPRQDERLDSIQNQALAPPQKSRTGDATPLVLEQFSENDFAPQLKNQFDKRLAELRKNNLAPSPDNSMEPPATRIENSVLKPSQKLAGQIPIEEPTQNVVPTMPKRDAQTSVPSQIAEEKRRLVPFRLNDAAQSRLVAVSPQNRRTLRIETGKFRDHRILAGETLQQISQKYYGKPDFYLDIYVANQDRLRNPTALPAGETIKIPVYQ